LGAVGGFLGFGLLLALVGELRPGAALVPLVRQSNQARRLQFGQYSPDPFCFLVVDRAGQRARDPQQVPLRATGVPRSLKFG
jgi:hypothetical protein